MFASTALVAVWTAMYLTSYTGYQTGFREPLSQLYGCHTGLKNVYHDHCDCCRVDVLVNVPDS